MYVSRWTVKAVKTDKKYAPTNGAKMLFSRTVAAIFYVDKNWELCNKSV